MIELLHNYLGGRWIGGTAAGTMLSDPVRGTDLVRVDATGLDLASGFAYAREKGGSGLRSLTYRRGGAISWRSSPRSCKNGAMPITKLPRPTVGQ